MSLSELVALVLSFHVALIVKDDMESNRPTGFPLLEVKNDLTDKVYPSILLSTIERSILNLVRRTVAAENSWSLLCSYKQEIVQVNTKNRNYT